MNKIVSLFTSQTKRADVLDNGIFDMRETRFARFAALHEDGTCYIGEGFRNKNEYADELRKHQKSGKLPDFDIQHVMRPLKEIDELYKGRSRDMKRATSESRIGSGKRRFLTLIDQAAKARASDIRLFVHDSFTDPGLKIADREVKAGYNWTAEEGEQAILALWGVQDDGSGGVTPQKGDSYSFSVSPQDRFPLPANVVKLRCELTGMETETGTGQFLTARVFYKNDPRTKSLDALGHDQLVLDAFTRASAVLRGATILGGETGDGKSTTLVRFLELVSDAHKNQILIATVEDPVEMTIDRSRVKQEALKSKGTDAEISAEYHKKIRSFKRQNPAAAMFSEVRDGTAAREMLRIPQSGHGLFTTIHVDNAPRIPFAMINEGVPPEIVGQEGLLRLLVKQTLARRLCDHCKTPLGDASLTDRQQLILEPIMDRAEDVFLSNSEGCAQCTPEDMDEAAKTAWAGVSRTFAVAEFIESDAEFARHIRANDYSGARAHWLAPTTEGGLGGISLEAKLTELVLMGQLDPFDCLDRKGDLSLRLTEGQRAQIIWRHS
jgi:hypothetical protein